MVAFIKCRWKRNSSNNLSMLIITKLRRFNWCKTKSNCMIVWSIISHSLKDSIVPIIRRPSLTASTTTKRSQQIKAKTTFWVTSMFNREHTLSSLFTGLLFLSSLPCSADFSVSWGCSQTSQLRRYNNSSLKIVWSRDFTLHSISQIRKNSVRLKHQTELNFCNRICNRGLFSITGILSTGNLTSLILSGAANVVVSPLPKRNFTSRRERKWPKN